MAEKKAPSGSGESSGASSAKKATKSSTKKATSRSSRSAPRAEAPRRLTGTRVAEQAVRQLGELTSKEIEGVTSLQKNDDGWVVELDVLELRRVPMTTDVLATYQVTLDSSGELEGYRRLGRYVRGQAEDGA
jgi:hypothetical protein